MVLLILIPAAWLAAVFFALTMFRLAARSDDSDAVALAELIAVGQLAEHRPMPADAPSPQVPSDPGRVRRATG
jgi:hypothetical protein